ncbi:MAG: hypothetical protein ACYC5M_01380 [Anaerolineae bacterium]
MMVRSVIALFDELQDARLAVQSLIEAGFPREQTSFVARDVREKKVLKKARAANSPERAVRGAIGGLADLLAGARSLDLGGIGPVVVAGPLAALLQTDTESASLARALQEMGIPEDQAEACAEGVRRDGVLVSVKTGSERASEATEILERYGPANLAERVEEYRREGWRGFDPQAAPYTVDDWGAEIGFLSTISMVDEQGNQRMRNLVRFGAGAQERPPDEQTEPRNGKGHAQPSRTRTLAEVHEVERLGPRPGAAEDRFHDLEEVFEKHYQQALADEGPYERFRPAYRFGYALAEDYRFADYDWLALVDEARRRWEDTNPDSWEEFADAIHSAWIETRIHQLQRIR